LASGAVFKAGLKDRERQRYVIERGRERDGEKLQGTNRGWSALSLLCSYHQFSKDGPKSLLGYLRFSEVLLLCAILPSAEKTLISQC
jgi:hypothetical protein